MGDFKLTLVLIKYVKELKKSMSIINCHGWCIYHQLSSLMYLLSIVMADVYIINCHGWCIYHQLSWLMYLLSIVIADVSVINCHHWCMYYRLLSLMYLLSIVIADEHMLQFRWLMLCDLISKYTHTIDYCTSICDQITHIMYCI
jgi:hypothetical protein